MDIYSWHSFTTPEVVRHFRTNAAQGLSDTEQTKRQEEYGKNILPAPEVPGIFARTVKQLQNPLALILLIAGVAAYILGNTVDASVIGIALVINVIIGLFQEGRAQRAFSVLTQGEKHTALVVRNGRRTEVLIEDIVVGDVVLLEAGAMVPADVYLIQENDLATNEAALTGEWEPVPKSVGELPKNTPLTGRYNMAYRGTTVLTGTGRGIVVAVGKDTEIGTIANTLQEDAQLKTPLQRNMTAIARFSISIVLFFVLLIVVLGLYRGQPIAEMLLLAIAVAVAAIPEGLPVAVTVSLALGMECILKKGGLMKNLLATETLGTTTVILTDKTGTLTHGKLQVVEYATLTEQSQQVRSANIEYLLTRAVLVSDGVLEEDRDGTGVTVHGRPLEKALLLAGLEAGITKKHLGTQERLLSIPFSSEYRYSGGVFRDEGNNTQMLYVVGAPEALLEKSTHVFDNGVVREMTPRDTEIVTQRFEKYTSDGLRVVALVQKDMTATPLLEHDTHTFVQQMTFVGLFAFADGIREDVPAAIRTVRSLGARVIMVTGDTPKTARYVAEHVGILDSAVPVYTGEMVERMSDAELLHTLHQASVFARILPKQKLRMARILRSAGEVVAMTGDGINDAPALTAATIGIAVGDGTDVAKEAADLVLLNNSFSIIVSAIEEGRRLRENIKKAVTFLLATNFSGTFIVVAALVLALPLPVLPVQILWANIVGGGFMNFAFAFEPQDHRSLARSPKDQEVTHILSRNTVKLIIMIGVITGASLLLLFGYLLVAGVPINHIRTLLFVGLSFDAFFFAFSLKSFTTPLWRIPVFSNKVLLGALFISLLVLLSAFLVPFVRTLLSVELLTARDVFLLALLGGINVVTIEFAKMVFFRKRRVLVQ